MRIKSIKDFKGLANKKVFLRADFNVPIKGDRILDEYKIIKQLPTIHFLLRNNCRVIIGTHLGRPQAGVYKKQFSTKVLAKELTRILDKKVVHVADFDFLNIGTKISRMKPGEVLMLENLRFEAGEKKNSKTFARKLARLADVYVNDAFAVSHRAHASLAAIKKYLPAFAGLLLEGEVKHLSEAFNPRKPLVLVVGGAKLKTKVPLIKEYRSKAWRILVGGALVNNFLAAHGYEVGKSLSDKESIRAAKKYKNKNIVLPLDVVVSTTKTAGNNKVKKVSEVDKNDYIFDIGPKTIEFYSSFIKRAQTVIWNGPMGFFEIKDYRHGTNAIARTIASRAIGKAFGVVGGGETVEALKAVKMMSHVDWVSTGGGAMLTFLAQGKMPGLVGLIKK